MRGGVTPEGAGSPTSTQAPSSCAGAKHSCVGSAQAGRARVFQSEVSCTVGCGSLEFVEHRNPMRLWRDFFLKNHTQKDILLGFKYSEINPRGKVLQSVEC